MLSQTIITGTVVDPNNQALPYAHVRIENTSYGTITNDIGKFRLVVDSDFSNVNRLIISSLGYKTETTAITDEHQTIVLLENTTQLDEVVLVAREKSTDIAKELILKAINVIPKNYPSQNEKHTGFFREKTYWENDKEPIYIAEAVIEAIKEDYTNKKRNGNVKLIQFRKYESNALDTLNTRIYGGSHHIHRFDIVARREAFLSNPERYQYEITDTLRQNGKDVIKVLITKKKWDNNTAHVYVEDDSFAIVKADIQLTSNFGDLGQREFFNYSVSYEQGEDKLWRFYNSSYTTAFAKQGKVLNLKSEYVTTEINHQYEEIPYLERIQFRDILLDENKTYNPNFWNNYTIITPSEISESLFKSIDYSPEKRSKKRTNKSYDFLRRLTMEMGINWTRLDIASNTVNYSNTTLDILQNNETLKTGAVGFNSSIFYTIKPSVLVGYANENIISRNGIIAHDIVLASTFNLNPNGRPIVLSPRFHFGFQEMEYFLKRYELESDIEVDGKRINSDEVDIFLSQRGFRIKPSLLLSIEQSNSIRFFLSASYNVGLNQKNGLTFRERDAFSFFPRKVFLENGQESLSVTSNRENVFENTVGVNVGLAFKF